MKTRHQDGLTLVRQAVLNAVELSRALRVRVPHHPFWKDIPFRRELNSCD